MRSARRIVVAMVVVVLATANVFAGGNVWFNGGQADERWSNPLNWHTGAVPVSGSDNPLISGLVAGRTYVHSIADISGSYTYVYVGYAGYNADLEVSTPGVVVESTGYFQTAVAGGTGNMNINNGATVKGTATAYMGFGDGGTSIVNVGNNGTLISLNQVVLGNSGTGTLNVTAGGVVNANSLSAGYGAGHGYVNIDGGTVSAVSLGITDGSYFNLIGNESKLILAGDQIQMVGDWAFAGYILGNGVKDSVVATYDAGTNLTTVMVPEPVTMSLLGLGALGFIGRKGGK